MKLLTCLNYAVHCFRNAWKYYKTPLWLDIHIDALYEDKAEKVTEEIAKATRIIFQRECA